MALPRKGKLSEQAQALEQGDAFARARRAQSGVESAINALEVHGLDRCPDHGINGFKRYVALAVVARNIHRIGAILWQREQERAWMKRNMPIEIRPTSWPRSKRARNLLLAGGISRFRDRARLQSAQFHAPVIRNCQSMLPRP